MSYDKTFCDYLLFSGKLPPSSREKAAVPEMPPRQVLGDWDGSKVNHDGVREA